MQKGNPNQQQSAGANMVNLQEHHAQVSPEKQAFCCGFCKYFRDVKQPSICSFWGDKVNFLDDSCQYSRAVIYG